MLEMIETNWIVFILALLIGLVVAWWIFARGTSDHSPRERRPDALDEGAAPAQRNQALIDAPPAAEFMAPPVAETLGGIGEVVSVAAHDEVEEARAAHPEGLNVPPPPSASPPSAGAEADDLRKIKGVGPKLVALLQSLGVTTYAQIAAWTDADIDRMDAQLGSFAGRIRRDSWVEQARLLSSGDTSAYETKFGKL